MRLIEMLDDETDLVVITDDEGVAAEYRFLDLCEFRGARYAVLEGKDSDGYVDIFLVYDKDGRECYRRVYDERVLDGVFEVFRRKNEDEFDFD